MTPEPQQGEERIGSATLIVVPVLLGLFTLVASSYGMEFKRPASSSIPAHIVTWGAAVLAIGVGLWASARCRSFGTRIGIGVGILLALAGFANACYYSYQNYWDYPAIAWIVAVGLVVFAWPAKQKLIGAAALIVVGLGVQPMITRNPPSPPAQEQGDLQATISAYGRGVSIRLKSLSGRELARRYDLDNVYMTASSGAIYPVEVGLVHLGPEEISKASEATLSTHVFKPEWLDHFSATVTVNQWPSSPGVRFEVKTKGVALPETRNGMTLLLVDHDPGSADGMQLPGMIITLRTVDPRYVDASFQVLDVKGNVLDFGRGVAGGGAETTYTLSGDIPKSDRLFVDVFTHDQMEEGAHTFTFRNLPIATSNPDPEKS